MLGNQEETQGFTHFGFQKRNGKGVPEVDRPTFWRRQLKRAGLIPKHSLEIATSAIGEHYAYFLNLDFNLVERVGLAPINITYHALGINSSRVPEFTPMCSQPETDIFCVGWTSINK